MGRGSSSSGGGRGSSSSGGGWSSSRGSSSSSRGWSSSSWGSSRGHRGGRHSHTTVFIGDSSYHGGGSGSGKGALIFIGIVFMIFGFAMLGTCINAFSKANDYGTVQAVCVDNDYLGGWYYTTYEYTVDGRDYESQSSVGWEFPETEGKIVTIYYLKANPYHITEEKPVSNTSYAVLIGGLIFGGAGIAMFVGGIRMKKQTATDTNDSNDDDTPSSSTKSEQTIRCAYCGSKYSASAHSCPDCGANN